MGKRRIVRPEDDEEIMADIKRSKLPLESRTGFMERTEHLRQIFMSEEKEYKTDWLFARSEPFPVCTVNDFLASPPHSIQELEDQMVKHLTLNPKKNDLYQFSQSDEIMKMSEADLVNMPRLSQFITEIQKLKQLFTVITGKEISEISMFFAEYKWTDHLLTHEDDLQNRVIAFVYYLNSDNWTKSDGGHFETYKSNSANEPIGIHESILPKRNSLNFFRVTDRSHHQVKEITSKKKFRRSLTGWFHTRDQLPPRAPLAIEEPNYAKKEFNVSSCQVFNDWINPVYVSIDSMSRIQTQFEEDSEIQLSDFIRPNKYEELLNYLEEKSENFVENVPFNRKYTLEYDPTKENGNSPLMEFLEVLNSDDFFLMLSNWTGLKLHPNFEGDESDDEEDSEEEKREPTGGAQRCSIRKWKNGNYTLLHDADSKERASVDLFIHLLPKKRKEWDIKRGGFVSYLTKGEDEELLTIAPKANSLSLVFRDEDTLRFVKYINSKANDDYFYDVFACYYE